MKQIASLLPSAALAAFLMLPVTAISQTAPPASPAVIEQSILAGMASAKAELARGIMQIRSPQPPAGVDLSVRNRVLSRYGVAEVPAGDVQSPEAEAGVWAHNEIVLAGIAQKYGLDFWQRVDTEINGGKSNPQR